MADSTLIPWPVLWVCAVAAVAGFVLTWHGIGQRNPSPVAKTGMWMIGLAVAAAFSVATINAGGFLALAFTDHVKTVMTHPHPEDQ